jgi:hypothetical protein
MSPARAGSVKFRHGPVPAGAYPAEKRTEARRLYRDGQSIREISETIGISTAAVYARVGDLARRRGPRPRPTIPDHMIVRLRDEEHMLWREIATEAKQSMYWVRLRYLRATDATEP